MTIALRYHLADENGVGFQGAGTRRKLDVFDVRAEVVRFETFVTFEPLVAGVAFVVEDGVDADGVRIAPRARPYDDDAPPEPLRDAILDLVVGQRVGFELGDFEPADVDAVRRTTIDDEVRIACRGFFHRGD